MKKESNQQSMEEVEHWEHTLPSPIKADRMEESRDAAGQDVRKRQHEDEHCGMASAMPLIVWTARPDGNVDYYNQRWFEYTGLTFEQTRGQGWLMVLHPDDRQMCLTDRRTIRDRIPLQASRRCLSLASGTGVAATRSAAAYSFLVRYSYRHRRSEVRRGATQHPRLPAGCCSRVRPTRA